MHTKYGQAKLGLFVCQIEILLPSVQLSPILSGLMIRCNGTLGVAGTGPWKFVKKVTNQRTIAADKIWDQVTSLTRVNQGERTLEVLFERNEKHWENAGRCRQWATQIDSD
jgi:hypothetical protein